MNEQKRNAERRTYHFIYRTTRIRDGRYYVGMHSTDSLTDGYMGSGTKITRSLKKHGRDAHKFEILEQLPDRKSLIAREEEIVSEELLKDPQCMNLMKGGTAGPYPNLSISLGKMGKPKSPEHRAAISATLKGRSRPDVSAALKGRKRPDISARKKGKTMSLEQRALISATLKGRPSPFKGLKRGKYKSRKVQDAN